jgi:anti-sigma factor RsiW
MASSADFTDHELLAYLDEMLPPARSAEVERALRHLEPLRRRAATLAQTRDQGVHSVGEIWRRRRLSCPTRSQLGSYLLGSLAKEIAAYVDFHLRTIGCRYCAANVADLEEAARSAPQAQERRRKFYQSSAGRLGRLEPPQAK